MKITIITDDIHSWFIPFGKELQKKLSEKGHPASYVHEKKEIAEGDVCFILSCTRLIGEEILRRNTNNIVVHASDLPSGRGWTPLQWQILEGKNEIMLTMFEAVVGMDEGPYYLKSAVKFDGTELLSELRRKMAAEIIRMCLAFVENAEVRTAKEQTGTPSYYRRRNEEDDELDINKPIKDLINQFRIADNERHPVYFRYQGKKYYLKVFPENNPTDLSK